MSESSEKPSAAFATSRTGRVPVVRLHWHDPTCVSRRQALGTSVARDECDSALDAVRLLHVERCSPVFKLSSHPRQHVRWDGRVCRLRAVQEDVLPHLANQRGRHGCRSRLHCGIDSRTVCAGCASGRTLEDGNASHRCALHATGNSTAGCADWPKSRPPTSLVRCSGCTGLSL